MTRIEIEGGIALDGDIRISGSKNAVIPCLAASILTDAPVKLENIPLITDLDCMKDIISYLGASVKLDAAARTITVRANDISFEIPKHYSTRIRGSILFLGALLARKGRVRMHGYGGCPIGQRPIDMHLDVFRRLGAEIKEASGFLEISGRELKGTRIDLGFPSVGATENAILAASLASGKTILNNVATEPEVVNLVEMLGSMGVEIEILPNKREVRIQGSTEIGSITHSIIPDRIETGTFAIAAGITNGEIELKCADVKHLTSVIRHLRQMGLVLETERKNQIRVFPTDGHLEPVRLVTEVYPGFPTDLQPLFTSIATRALGTSNLVESIYGNRFHHVPELRRMGAKLHVSGRRLTIYGPTTLKGARVQARDLRGGAALILAALSADGITTISQSEHISRGYEAIDEKLRRVGANIEVISDG